MKRFESYNWTMTPHYPYTPFRVQNMETDVKNQSILPPIPCQVPGSIYDALQKAGVIEDPFFEMNSLKCQWVSNHWWVFDGKIDLDPKGNGERLELVLEGIDCMGHIFFNGKKLGQSDNMYVPFVADVTDIARKGSNTVTVVLENAPDEMGQIGYTSRTFTQKARFSYKWDWCTRLISVGLYRPVYVRAYNEVRFEDFYFKPVGTNGDAEFYATLHGDTKGCTVEVSIGNCLVNCPLDSRGREAKARLHVDDVKLWYPLDVGEQNLYDLTMSIIKDGVAVETRVEQVGFRQISLEQNDNAPLGALGYVFNCNGTRVYAKGVNLTPIDMTGYNDPAKMEQLLTMMKKAHINVIRVWGGGVIEDETFYRLCDRMGFMVWQEFIQSSSGLDNVPSKIEQFLVRQEATAKWAIKTRRNHPSLAVWSGGNELMNEEGIPSTFADRNIAELLGYVSYYSPHIPMLPTSASGPYEFLDPAHKGENHDVHGSWRYYGTKEHYRVFNESDSLFHSEFGVDGMMSVETMKTFLSEDNLKPDDMAHNHVWRHHGEWWDNSWRDKHIFGEPTTLEQQVARSQFIQAEGLRYAVEANRRRAFENSGSIIWQINEPYPNISCTCMIDYCMRAKPVLWQVGKAFAPLNVSIKYDKLIWKPGEEVVAEVFVSLDGEEREVSYSYGSAGQLTEGKAVCGHTRAVKVGEIRVTAEGKYVDFTLKAEDGVHTFENTIRLLVRQENGLCSDEGVLGFYPENE